MFGIEGHLDRLEAPPEPAIWDTPPANNTDIDLRRDETPSRRLRKPRFASVTTTRVFRPVVAEGFEWVQPVNESDFDVVYQLSGESMVSQWIPIEVRELKELSETDTPLLPADMPWLGGHTLLCRERAYAILSPLLEDAGEFLELDLIDSGEPLWLFNACTIIDGLDEESRMSSGFQVRQG